MWPGLLLAVVLAQAQPSPAATSKPVTVQNVGTARKDDSDDSTSLTSVKRIYVDSFGDDIISRELQSMIVSSLTASKRFKVTENKDKADAVLKGVALEKSSQEVHAYGEATSVGAAGGHSEISGSDTGFSGSGGFIGKHMGTSDSSLNTETVNEARIAVRLVSPDGDVIWTTTQESKGAKYKGASADVADKCVKQLVHDVEKLESSNAAPTGPTPTGLTNRPQ